MSKKSQYENEANLSVMACYDRREKVFIEPDDEDMAFLRANEIGNSKRLRARYGQDMAFVKKIGWLCWNGSNWDREEGDDLALTYAMRTAEKIYDEAEVLQLMTGEEDSDFSKRQKAYRGWAKTSCSRSGCNAMLDLAKPALVVAQDQFDQADYMVAVTNGKIFVDRVYNKDDGTVEKVDVGLVDHARGDLNTHICDVNYQDGADCPGWRKFVKQILPDDDVALYFQKTMGYALLGDRSLQVATFLYGKGSDGKSTAIEVISQIVGSYAKTVGIGTFLYNKFKDGARASPDIARLPGIRLVRTSEPNVGVRLDEEILKTFSGGEEVTARHLNLGFFEFYPKCMLLFSLNHKPTITGKDFGIKRRIRIIPFEQSFGKPDETGKVKNPKKNQKLLISQLLREKSGILNWLLDGARMVLVDGLEEPEKVAAAKRAWFEENDPVGNFIRECCTVLEDKTKGGEENSKLYGVYQDWCKETTENEKSCNVFGRRLADMGFLTKKTNGKYLRLGLVLRADAVFGEKEDVEDLYGYKDGRNE